MLDTYSPRSETNLQIVGAHLHANGRGQHVNILHQLGKEKAKDWTLAFLLEYAFVIQKEHLPKHFESRQIHWDLCKVLSIEKHSLEY